MNIMSLITLQTLNYPNYELSITGEVFSVERLTGSFKGDKLLSRIKLTPTKGYVWLTNQDGKRKFSVSWLVRHMFNLCLTHGPLTLPNEVWASYEGYQVSSLGRVLNKHLSLVMPDKSGYLTLTLKDVRLRLKIPAIIDLFKQSQLDTQSLNL